jgi:hypothetical protein
MTGCRWNEITPFFKAFLNRKEDHIMLMNIKKNWQTFCDQLWIYSLNITMMATMLLIFVFLGATSYLYMQSPSSIAHRQELEEYFSQANAKRQWIQLHKYHGYPSAVIYEEGKTPYFYNKEGIKCSFIYPSKGARPSIREAEDSNKYYAALTWKKELVAK